MIKSLIQDICQYAINNDLCNLSQGGTSLYEINFKEQKNYPIIFVSPSSVNSVGVNVVKYSFTIYYLDRLLKDNSNDIDILNSSNTVLQKLINIIRNFDYVLKVDDNYNITNFSDSSHLADCVAGGYVNLSITVQNTQGLCAVDAVLPTIKVVLQNKNIKIEENGDYLVTFDNGYSGLKEVKVDVNIDTESFYQEGFSKGKTEGIAQGKEEQKSLIQPITITENGEYTNENGFSPINVNLDLESIYDNGYNEGIEQGKEEQKSLLTSINITENGNYTNENGYNEVIVNVGDTPKPKLPNGISLGYSTFTTIDMSNWDWSNVYDWSEMFNHSYELSEIQNFPSNIEIYGANEMFSACYKLQYIPQLNTSKCIIMSKMFEFCGKLETIPQIDCSSTLYCDYMFRSCSSLIELPELNTINCLSMQYMFYGCTNLTSIPELNTSKCTNMQYMFNTCRKLTSIPEIDITNVTDMRYMFTGCDNLNEIKFKGNPTKLDALYLSNIFYTAGSLVENPKMYYPQEFETNYQKIISRLPSKWTAVPY